MKSPFFSIVIPTHNRDKELRRALTSVLEQTYADYEIVITDNSDNVFNMDAYKNEKRICYFKNKENIGFTRNLYKGIGLAKGEYIFTLGDDDWLGNANLLMNIYQRILKDKYGYIRIKFIYCDQNKNQFSLYLNKHIVTQINPQDKPLNILNFLNQSIYTGISGLVFKQPKNKEIKLITENNTAKYDLSDFWVKYLFDAVKENGGWIDFEDVINFSWSQYQSPTFYYLVNKRLPKEAVWELLKDSLSKEEMKTWIKNETTAFSRMLPSIKHYSSRLNLIAFANRLLQLNPDLKWHPGFYFGLLIGLVMPRWLWRWLRAIVINCSARFL